MKERDISIMSVNDEDLTIKCSDGEEYPLVEGLEMFDTDNLQAFMNSVKIATIKILEDVDNYAGQIIEH